MMMMMMMSGFVECVINSPHTSHIYTRDYVSYAENDNSGQEHQSPQKSVLRSLVVDQEIGPRQASG